MVTLRSARNYDANEASRVSGLACDDKSLAVQSQKAQSDINVIVKRFGLTGEIPVSQRVPITMDIDEVMDYRTCLDFVRRAQASFDSLPSAVRARFQNDAAAFCDFAEDAANLPQLREWGLAPIPPADPPAPAPAPAG